MHLPGNLVKTARNMAIRHGVHSVSLAKLNKALINYNISAYDYFNCDRDVHKMIYGHALNNNIYEILAYGVLINEPVIINYITPNQKTATGNYLALQVFSK